MSRSQGCVVCIVFWCCAIVLPAWGSEVVLNGPFGIAVKPDGAFYAAEIGAKRIAKFAADGSEAGFITDISGYGSLKRPFDIDVSPSGKLYIVDNLGHSVLVLDEQEKLILTLGTGEPSGAPGAFHEPHFVAADETRGRIYVADTLNHRLQAFDMNGRLVNNVGKVGKKQPGDFYFCNGVTVGYAGAVYAMNWTGAYVNIFDADLNIVKRFGRRGYGPGEFNDAYSIVCRDDAIWVADTYNNRLQRFSTDWRVLDIIGGEEGADVHHLSHPTDLDFDAAGNIYVADWMNDRVVKLTPDGHFLRAWGSRTAVLDFVPPAVVSRSPCRGPLEIGTYSSLMKITIDKTKRAGADWIYYSCNNQSGDWAISADEVAYAREVGVNAGVSIAVFHLGAEDPRWRQQPQYYMWKKGATGPDSGTLSYFWPEVRQWKARHIAAQIKRLRLDGVFLDYIRYPNALYGYEPAMVQAFREETGRDAHAISMYDRQWLKFRAQYVTLLIAEIRRYLAELDWPVQISVFVNPDPEQNLRASLQEWPVWSKMGIIDKIHIGVYTRHIPTIYESVVTARPNLAEHTSLSMMLCCWGGNLNTPELLHKGAEVAVAAGADDITIYRGDTIDQLQFWPVIAEIAALYK